MSLINISSLIITEINHTEIITSFIQKLNSIKGYRFQRWKYATVKAKFIINRELQDMCPDTECIMSLINCQFLKAQLTGTLIEKIITLIKVKGISSIIY